MCLVSAVNRALSRLSQDIPSHCLLPPVRDSKQFKNLEKSVLYSPFSKNIKYVYATNSQHSFFNVWKFHSLRLGKIKFSITVESFRLLLIFRELLYMFTSLSIISFKNLYNKITLGNMLRNFMLVTNKNFKCNLSPNISNINNMRFTTKSQLSFRQFT